MGRTSTRLPSFCLSRVATRVRVRSPTPIESKPVSSTVEPGRLTEPSGDGEEDSGQRAESGVAVGRRIMIAVDSSTESKGALQWALSHAVQSTDTIVLLDVVKPSKHGGDQAQRERDPKSYELLYSMKSICQAKKSDIQVELSLVEGKDRGPTIVEEARKQGVSLLVLGQRRQSIAWHWLMLWAGNRIGGNVADYCVQNATCMALAVRKKSRKGGGYLITTRRHKDFWLLA